MATKETWDFECPQFVDFIAGLNNSGFEDVFFDCKDHQSPEDDEVISQSPSVSRPQKYLSEEEENKLLDKMTLALSIIENTPKVKKPVVKGKLLTEKFPKDEKKAFPVMSKSTVKPNAVPKTKLHRSKSIAQLNKIMDEKKRAKDGLRKRSSSLSDLRFLKKQKYPRTPVCLKRTIVKAKSKIIKTSEELELEEIAKLQKKLIHHLRHNEMSLKRLGLKPRTCTMKIQAKHENLGVDNIPEKKDAVEKGERRKLNKLNPAEVKKEAKRLENIFNQATSNENIADGGESSKSKPPVTFPAISIVKENSVKETKKSRNVKKYAFHSGLIFRPNIKKNTVVVPFSFDAKIKEAKDGAEKKAEISGVHIKIDGKENVPSMKPLSIVKKSKEIHNVPCDNVPQSSKKIMQKKNVNPMKGLPLSENIARK